MSKKTSHNSPSMVSFRPRNSAILYGYRGSIAHGLYIHPDSLMGTDDVDLMGVCVAPLTCYFGLDHFEGMEYWEKVEGRDHDIVFYELRKFVRLLTKANPNVLGFLWNIPKMMETIRIEGQLLINNRHLFATKLAYPSFVGYAKSQLKKMTAQKYQGYMGTKRKLLVDNYGYDTKNASHLIRLLRMGVEFLNTGELTVFRTDDADELRDIKQGKWSMEKVKREANALFEAAAEAMETSPLPDTPDMEAINKLLLEMFYSFQGRPSLGDEDIIGHIGGEAGESVRLGNGIIKKISHKCGRDSKMPTLKYYCARCPATKIIKVGPGDLVKKSIKCPICGIGRMRLPRETVVGAKNSGGKSFRRKPF